ncbi:multidrug efflux MFS transporter [Bacillaceae bacterium SIJ1]|uniref:MDR family MFS transporter n=1 Tax=Litoribacterium kuwaitense TaxID=1398745 RepID=UPI0013EBD780|nr:MDR family MFS transporter [Litoribacterium kuwaitense]NGP46518.1 multidrug efflux MFS transporter [Litoribacterium kuwaitense]
MKKVPHQWKVVITVLLGTFTVILNNSMLNPAIPEFRHIFNATPVAVGWIISIFMVGMGMTMPLTGFLSSKFGKKKVYMTGLAIFVIASFLGSLAWNLGSLVAFRGIQGVGGGMMMPLSMAFIFDAFPREQRGKAMGVWGVAAMVAPSIGPTLGGFLVEFANWHYLFLCNIPVGIIGFMAAQKYLKKESGDRERMFDVKGFVFVTVGVGLVMVVLSRVRSVAEALDPLNITLLIIGIISFIAFVLVERKTETPLLDVSLFRIPAYTISVWVTVSSSISLFAGIYLLPLLIQDVYGYNAVVTGLVLLPGAICTGIFMNVGGRLLDKSGPTKVVTVGLVIMAIAFMMLGQIEVATSMWFLVVLMGVRGVGNGLTNIPATTTGMNSIPDKDVAQGSAMNNVIRQISSAFAVVFASLYFQLRSNALEPSIGEKAAQLGAITEFFWITGFLLALTIPAGILLGRTTSAPRKKASSEPHGA